ncbi:MAG: 2Fe-2S iron-sulfur cluster-binding protein, partial [SAR324 cluster bacterium]|nr:2Fe-2S iron-sulfur cluster-binding protein [SAR324 cluster bacterium]
QAFVEFGAAQCGYCTPGMLMSAKSLIDHESNPKPQRIREALAGNLCRCTGYAKIIDAVGKAASVSQTATDTNNG